MNTLAHLAAMVAIMWFAVYAFNTLGIMPLGVALIGLFIVFMTLTLLALGEDIRIITGKGGEE